MLYSVTFNPSLDYYVKVPNLKLGAVNRTSQERLAIGGKGINVSLELMTLGNQTEALGFVAGFTGNELIAEVNKTGLAHDFIEVAGRSRINVKVKSNTETDINGSGAIVTPRDVDRLTEKLRAKLKYGDWVIISGSVPPGVDNGVYAQMMEELRGIKGIRFVVDASGDLLLKTLKYKPFLIKPNLYELCELFNVPPTIDIRQIRSYAWKLQQSGAKNVIVSLGSMGAVMVTETEQAMYVRAASGQLVNSVGAGDCMVAGFVHEYIRTDSFFKALNFATAAGSACAFTESLPTREQIEYVESLML